MDVYIAARLPIALDTTTDILLISSRFRNLRRGTGSGEPAIGFIPIAVPSNDYFWIIEQGPTAGIAEEAITASTAVQMDLKPGTEGKLLLRNAAADEGAQLIATFANGEGVSADGYMQVIARIGG